MNDRSDSLDLAEDINEDTDPSEAQIQDLTSEKKSLTIAVIALAASAGLLLLAVIGLWWRGRKNAKQYSPLDHRQAMKEEAGPSAKRLLSRADH